MEYGEQVEDTLKREISEEYNTDIIFSEFIGYRDIHKLVNGQKVHWIAVDFKVYIDKSKVKIGEPHKFDQIGWFKLADFPSPMHSQFPDFLEKYQHIS